MNQRTQNILKKQVWIYMNFHIDNKHIVIFNNLFLAQNYFIKLKKVNFVKKKINISHFLFKKIIIKNPTTIFT